MTTGDLMNNVKKMRSKLKMIKYFEELDVPAITQGSPKAYLPVYHYAFTSYSPALSELILSSDIELYGKSDTRFIEAIYKVLRDIFTYKPPVTKEQFFSKGFVERKVIMCTEILDLVKRKHTQLNPGAARSSAKLGSRPKSLETVHTGLPAFPKTMKAPKSGKTKPCVTELTSNYGQATQMSGPRPSTQVVNELTATPSSPPTRHVAHSNSHVVPVRHIAPHHSGRGSSQHNRGDGDGPSIPNRHEYTSHETIQQDSWDGISILCRPSTADKLPVTDKRVTLVSPPQIHHISPVAAQHTPDTVDTDIPPEFCFNTPSIRKACSQKVEVVTIPRGIVNDTLEPSILDIQAPTSDSVLQGPVASTPADLVAQVTSLQQTVKTLTQLVYNQNTQLLEVSSSQDPAVNRDVDQKVELIQSQLCNLAARLTLIENRVSIIEAKAGELQEEKSVIPPVLNTMSRPTSSMSRHELQAAISAKAPVAISGNSPGTQLIAEVNANANYAISHANYADTHANYATVHNGYPSSLVQDNVSAMASGLASQPNGQGSSPYGHFNGLTSSVATSARASHQNGSGIAGLVSDTSGSTVMTDGNISSSDRGMPLPECGQQLFSGPGPAFAAELKSMLASQDISDASLNYSPIRKVTNGIAGSMMTGNEDTFALEDEEDERRSSTPTGGRSTLLQETENSLQCNFSDIETNEKASRISSMLKDTMNMIKASGSDSAPTQHGDS